jgi:hypothetical protein
MVLWSGIVDCDVYRDADVTTHQRLSTFAVQLPMPLAPAQPAQDS